MAKRRRRKRPPGPPMLRPDLARNFFPPADFRTSGHDESQEAECATPDCACQRQGVGTVKYRKPSRPPATDWSEGEKLASPKVVLPEQLSCPHCSASFGRAEPQRHAADCLTGALRHGKPTRRLMVALGNAQSFAAYPSAPKIRHAGRPDSIRKLAAQSKDCPESYFEEEE
jgi:hypothetical protein